MADPTPPPALPAGYVSLVRDQRQVDAGHLRLLSIFHYALAALGVVFLGFLFLHYSLMRVIFEHPERFQHGQASSPPKEFFAIFIWFYVIAGALIVLGMAVNALSGWFIARREARTYSLVIAGLDCMQLPFGTILGVFTLIVLLRDSVRLLYEEARRSEAPAGASTTAR